MAASTCSFTACRLNEAGFCVGGESRFSRTNLAPARRERLGRLLSTTARWPLSCRQRDDRAARDRLAQGHRRIDPLDGPTPEGLQSDCRGDVEELLNHDASVFQDLVESKAAIPMASPQEEAFTRRGEQEKPGGPFGPPGERRYLPWCALNASICRFTASRLNDAGSCIGG